MRRLVTTALIVTGLALPQLVQAGPLSGAGNNARDYIPAPAGTAVMVTYWKHLGANKVYNDGDQVASGAGVSADLFILRPIYYTQVGPIVFDPQVLIIGQDVEVDGGGAATGFADPLALATFFLVNRPADKFWLGVSPFITVPIGEYKKSDPAHSAGGNRWTIRPEIGMVKGFGEKFYFDVTASAEFFEDNKDFGRKVGGGYNKLEQDTQFHLESHLSYDLSKSFFAALDYYGYFGGETKINGTKQDDKKSNHAIGLTGAYAFAPGYQLMLQWKDDVSVDDGPKVNTFMARFLYAW